MGAPGLVFETWESTNPHRARISCDPESAMKLLLVIVVAVVFLGSLIADYKWRKWMADRKRDRQ